MALQTSGAISLNQIHVEAGGSSGTACTINDADIRGLIGKSSGAASSFSDFYGASSALDTQTVTVGYYLFQFYGSSIQFYGYYLSGAYGSISDGTANWKSNVAYSNLYWMSTNNTIVLGLQGSRSNSGFTTMNIAGTNYSRTSASFSSSSSVTYWQWANQSNSFGTTTGATKTVTFT